MISVILADGVRRIPARAGSRRRRFGRAVVAFGCRSRLIRLSFGVPSMRGIAISRLLMFAVFVPLAGLALFGGWHSYDSWSRYSDLSRASSVLRLAVATSRLAGIAIPAEGAATREVVGGARDLAKLD